MNYFIYNGQKSSDYKIYIKSRDVYSVPKRDVSFTTIPGRNGELINPPGRFPNATATYSCFVKADSPQELTNRTTEIKNWLLSNPTAYLTLEDGYDLDHIRRAVYINKLDFAVSYGKVATFQVVFSCMPFRYLKSGLNSETHSDIFTLRNPYAYTAKPYIKVVGSGKGSLVIQSRTKNAIWDFNSIDGFIECDSELMSFYKGTENKNSFVIGDGFPELPMGDTTISFDGGIESVEIKPRWVTL